MSLKKICKCILVCMLLVLCVGCAKTEKSINESLIGKWVEVEYSEEESSLTFTSESTVTLRYGDEAIKCSYIIYNNRIEFEFDDNIGEVIFELNGNVLTLTFEDEERDTDITWTCYKEGSSEYNKALEEYEKR